MHIKNQSPDNPAQANWPEEPAPAEEGAEAKPLEDPAATGAKAGRQDEGMMNSFYQGSFDFLWSLMFAKQSSSLEYAS